jgi:hypothetical protein
MFCGILRIFDHSLSMYGPLWLMAGRSLLLPGSYFDPRAALALRTPQVHKKIEVRGGEKKELNFLLMESCPGVNDVYVPKNIFTGHDRSVWDGIKVRLKT